MPEQDDQRRPTAVITLGRECVCVRFYSHSFLIAKGTSGTEITDSAGRMMDTHLSG